MSRLGNIAVWLFAAVFLGLGLTIAGAADRSIELVPQVDLPGFDYAVSKNVSLGQCQSACVDDRACQAFTFNEKAKWCFLKGAAAAPVAFKGATSGRIVSSPTLDELYEQRIRDLSFSAMGLIEGARSFASGLPSTDPAPEGFGYHDLVTEADAAMAEGNAAGARVFLRQALGINGNDPATWIKLASASLSAYNAAVAANGRGDYEIATDITYAGLNAFLKSEPTRERATALAYLARGLEGREMWREAIATYRDSLELVDDAALAARLDTVVAEHGFRVVSHEIDAESAQPRICAVFSDPLASGDVDLASFVSVAGNPRLAVEREDNQLCLEGVMHGARYHVTLRAGLPSSDGEELRNTVELDLYVPDRSPFVGFANNAYVMPAGLGGGLPMTSVNATSADVAIYRIGDRAIAAAVRDGVFRQTLDNYSAEDIAFRTGQLAFEGTVDLAAAALNEMGVTAIPVADMLGELAPGAYVITAKVTDAEEDYWSELATQWFIVTDLGLSVVSGNDGIHAFARSLTGTEPVAGASVRLVAVNNEILGEAVTDENGRADFAPGLGRGDGGMAPQLLVAETDAGDYAFLDLGRPAFDLSDRGVTGRPTAGPLDLFATTERGVYRPGETVFLTALLRDSRAEAVTGLPLTLQFERPDGILSSSETVTDLGAGSYFTALDLRSNAMRGSWHARLFADPKAQPLADISFLVQDFEPERLAFDISAPEGMVSEDAPLPVSVVARYLYGATAPNLSIEADAILRPRTTLPDYPGYTFGREDDTVQTDQIPLGIIAATDQSGEAVADVYLPEPMPSTRPLDAQIVMRLIDSNGRPVTRSLTRPVMATTDRIGISPAFKGSELGEGSEAGFDIITVAPDGALAARTGLEWTLSRITTTYQWYRTGGTWKWEAITTTSRVANGSVDTAETGAVRVSAPVDWGRYLFEIETTGDNPTSSSQSFYAGYYYAEAGSDTPDTLDVALDKKAYAVGETAVLRLEPQFAGTALVLVVDDRIIDMQAVDVPEGGTSVSLPVTADWGPGAYVTAMLYRPADAGEKRMPARAVGLAFADVDPGERLIGLALDVPEEALPREAFTATVDVGAAAAGTRAYVAVAAVDLGILNLTGFETPDPDGWFYGQRQLGVDIRDLYGQLIDPTQGLPGAFRSGGDGMGGSGAPPPTSVLVALHSGIVTVGDDGTASVEFDMPDFNGTVRVMAMAWTDNAVGHAEKDVVVHDPVVVTLSPPRFLRVDDSARLLVEIANVSGEEGGYAVELTTGNGLSADVGNRSFELAAGGRVALDFVLTGKEIGDHDLRLLLTDPSGNALVKTLTLGVRPTSVATTTTVTWPIEPGASIDVDNGYFAGLLPGTGTLTLAVGPLARLNVPELLLALDRYPYGCAEQVTSRALPLLYLNDVAGMIGLGEDGEIDGRVRSAIADLMSKQTYSGGFGLWGPFSYTEMWLDGYVTDFLLRAKSAGYDVPADGLERALDNLGNQVSYASDFDFGGEDIAYALYDLARAGRASIGDLRYYLEARLDNFATPLAKAQIGAALALYGERARASEAFEAAIDDLRSSDEDMLSYRSDYGSRLRDLAGVLALAAETQPAGVDTRPLAQQLAGLRNLERYTSTQEDAWTLLAAAALGTETADGDIAIDAEPVTGPVYRRYSAADLMHLPVLVENTGNRATEATISVTGIPETPPAATSNGFTISRSYYRLDGTPIEGALFPEQNDRFVVVLSVTAEVLGSGQYVISDPLPAGFEIENPDLSAGSGVGDLAWLIVDAPVHVESRTDTYVAAFRYVSEASSFSTAYMVRAVTPGTFTLPGASVEDMYRPAQRANTDAGEIVIGTLGG